MNEEEIIYRSGVYAKLDSELVSYIGDSAHVIIHP